MANDFYGNELNIGDEVIYVPSKPHKSISFGTIKNIHNHPVCGYVVITVILKDPLTKKERVVANINGEQLIKLEYFKKLIENLT